MADITLAGTGQSIPEAVERITQLARAFGSVELGDDVGTHMTCIEAEALADVMRLVDPDAATAFLRGHAEGDDDGDTHHVCTVCEELTYWHPREAEAGGTGEYVLLDANRVTDHRHQDDNV